MGFLLTAPLGVGVTSRCLRVSKYEAILKEASKSDERV